MQDYMASLESLRRDAAEAAIVRDLATNPDRRALYHRLHEHYTSLANEVEKALEALGAKPA